MKVCVCRSLSGCVLFRLGDCSSCETVADDISLFAKGPIGEKCCTTEDGDCMKGGVCGTSRRWVFCKWGENDPDSAAVGDDTPLLAKGL